ncbi:MAG: hypothetical protein WDO56_20075 [Gammaproteobacteria bacterium]
MRPAGAGRAQLASGAQGRSWDEIRKLPDWSGVWVISDESVAEAFGIILGAGAARVPLTEPYAALLKANAGNRSNNETKCIPVGIPESLQISIGHEYLFTPRRVTAIFENGIVRRIDTSGNPHPPESELTHTFAGNSIGRWEGQTLVVDTLGLSSQAEFVLGLRVTEGTHLSERIFLKDRDTLQLDTVMEDPAIFTKPYAYTRLYKRTTAVPMLEYYPCVDGARDTMTNGFQTGVDLTPPPVGRKP